MAHRARKVLWSSSGNEYMGFTQSRKLSRLRISHTDLLSRRRTLQLNWSRVSCTYISLILMNSNAFQEVLFKLWVGLQVSSFLYHNKDVRFFTYTTVSVYHAISDKVHNVEVSLNLIHFFYFLDSFILSIAIYTLTLIHVSLYHFLRGTPNLQVAITCNAQDLFLQEELH